ncbi:MAG TPA: hypothetical protein VFJ28_15180 [Marmoricola sp.]|nr:hypothetical protein [Marmoricola sp.]
MTTGSIGPGTVLAGRYRLDDLLAESEGARFWRATDTVLARSVAIHAVPSDDPRAAGLLDAARVSATVVDPHLLRVLDCEDADGITWVVNEWGDGISLDLMLQRGPLSPSRAAWLAREVAEAIASGHAQGVAHGRLNPESVLVTHAGAVKLIGYVVDAALQDPRPPDPLYGELDEREADVINVAGILYAALTGRWPGVAPSSVPAAPREARRPLRPRQVRAGVPRALDTICDRVLHKEASRHAMPVETAHEIAAALSDYVGDPSLAAPIEPASLYDEPTVSLRRDQLPGALPAGVTNPSTDPDATQMWQTGAESATEGAAEPATSTDEETQVAPAVEPGAGRDADRDADRDAQPDEEPTRVTEVPAMSADTDPDTTRVSEPPPPPPPFEDIPERPLFASTERRVPRAAGSTGAAAFGDTGTTSRSAAATDLADDPSGTGGGGSTGFWPFDDDEEDEVHTGREGRGWLRTAIVVAVLIVLGVAMAVAFTMGRNNGAPTPTGGDDSPSASPSTDQPIRVVSADDFDPEGDPAEENGDEAGNAVDGDPQSTWPTMTYRGRPDLGGLKSGVGLMLDLGRDREVGSVVVRFNGSPTSLEVYASSPGVTSAPTQIDQMDKVGGEQDAGDRAVVRLDPRPTSRFLVVWLTELPSADGGFRGEISDITARS